MAVFSYLKYNPFSPLLFRGGVVFLINKKGNSETEQTKIMSYSVSFIGEPKKVAEALDAYSEKLSGPSKDEYDKAKPHVIALVNQNFGNGEAVKISMHGHGYIVNGEPLNSSCSVTLEAHYGTVV